MTTKSEAPSSLLQQRQTIYGFLQRVFEKELTREDLAEMPEKMKGLKAVAGLFASAEANQAVRDLVKFTDSIGEQDLGELQIKLAADYARLFLSLNKAPPHPSESVYREGTIMQYSRDEVLKTYWSFGVSSKKEFTEPEDHIAIELSFMAFLCEKAALALKGKDVEKAGKYLEAQGDFLEKHLGKWMPKLVEDILANGRTPFYKSMAVITREYLVMDKGAIGDLLKELKS
jgi:TorA maturation chaperone TorD